MHPLLFACISRLLILLLLGSLPAVSFAGTPSPVLPQVQRVRALPRQHTDEGRVHTMTPEKLAKLSLIFGAISVFGLGVFPLLTVFCCIPGVVFGIQALARMDRQDPASRRDKRTAIVGLAMSGGSLLILAGLTYLIIYLAMIA